MYGQREAVYSRFEPNLQKHNFASIFLPIAGIDLEPKKRSFPQIQGKASKAR
jgi:hypothetical protein